MCAWWQSSNPFDNGRVPVTPDDGRPEPPEVTKFSFTRTHAGARLAGGGAASSFSAYSEPTNHSKIETIHTPGKLNTGIPYYYLASGTTKDFLYDTNLFDFLPYEISEIEERLDKSGFDLWLDLELHVATVVRCGFSNVHPLNGVTSSVRFSRESMAVAACDNYSAAVASLLYATTGSYDSVNMTATVLYAESTNKAVTVPDACYIDTSSMAFATGPFSHIPMFTAEADVLALACAADFVPKVMPVTDVLSCALALPADMHLIASSRFAYTAEYVEAIANVHGTAIPVKDYRAGFECSLEFPMLLRTASQAADVLGVLPEVIVSAEYPVAAPVESNVLTAEVSVLYGGHSGLDAFADKLLSEFTSGPLLVRQEGLSTVDLIFSAVLEAAYPVRIYTADVLGSLLLPQAEKFNAPAKLDTAVIGEHARGVLSLDAAAAGYGLLSATCIALHDTRFAAEAVTVASITQLTAEAGSFLPTPLPAHIQQVCYMQGNLYCAAPEEAPCTSLLLFGTVESTYGREYSATVVNLGVVQSSVLLPAYTDTAVPVLALTAIDAHISSNPVQLGCISTVISARSDELFVDICPAMDIVAALSGMQVGWNSVAFTADSTLYDAPMSIQDAYTAAIFADRAWCGEHVAAAYSLEDTNARPVLTGSIGWGDEEAYVLDSAYASGTAHIQHVFTKKGFTAPMFKQGGPALYKGDAKYVYKYSYALVRETASHSLTQLVASYACNQRSYMEFTGLSIAGVSCTEEAPRLLSQLNCDYGMCIDVTGQVMVYDGTDTGLMPYRSEFSWGGVKFSDILPVTEEENKLRSLLNADFGYGSTLPGVLLGAFMIGGCGSRQYDMPWTFPADLLDAYGASLYSADRSPAYHACVYANINEFGKAQAGGWSFDALSIAGLEIVRTMAAPAAGIEMHLTTEAPLLITLPCIIQHHSREYAGSEVLVAYSPDARPSFANVHFTSMAAAMPAQVMVYADGSRSALASKALAVFGVGAVFSSPVPFPLSDAAADASGQLLGLAEACNRKEQHWDALYLSALEVCEDGTLRPDFGPHTVVLEDQMLGVFDHQKFAFMEFIAYTVGGLLTGHGSHDGIVVPHRALYPSAVAITLPAVKLAMTSHVSAYATFDAVSIFGVSLTEDTICVPKYVFCAPENTGTSYAEQGIPMGIISLSGGYAGGIGDILEMGAADLYYADGLGSSSSVAASVSLTPANENKIVRRRVPSRPLVYDRLWSALLGVGLLYKDFYAMQITPVRPPAWGDDEGVAALSRCFHMPVVSKATTVFGISATVDYTYADAWLFWKGKAHALDSTAVGVSGPVVIGGQSTAIPGTVSDIGYGFAESDLEIHGDLWLTSGYSDTYALNYNSTARSLTSQHHSAEEAVALMGVYAQSGGFSFYGAEQYIGSSAPVSFGTGIDGSPVLSASGAAPYHLWASTYPTWGNRRFDSVAATEESLASLGLLGTGMSLPGVVQEINETQHAVLQVAILSPAVETVGQGDSALYPGVGQKLPGIIASIPIVSSFVCVPAPESAGAAYAVELSAYLTQSSSVTFLGSILTPEVTFWSFVGHSSGDSVAPVEAEFAAMSLAAPITYAGAVSYTSGVDISQDSTFSITGAWQVEHGTASSYTLFNNWRELGGHGSLTIALGYLAEFDASTGAVRMEAVAQEAAGSAQGKGMSVALYGPDYTTVGTSAAYSLNAVFFAGGAQEVMESSTAEHPAAAMSMSYAASFTAAEATIAQCYGAFGYTHIYGPDSLTIAREHGYTVVANPASFGSASAYLERAVPVYAAESILTLRAGVTLPGAEAEAYHATGATLWSSGPVSAIHRIDEVTVLLSLSAAVSSAASVAEMGSSSSVSELQILGFDYLSGTAQYDLLFNSGQRTDGLSEASGIAALLSVGEPAMELPGSEQAVLYFAGMPIVSMPAEVQELTGVQLAALTSEFSTGLEASIQETHALFSSADPYTVVYSETYAADDGLFGIVACGTGGPEFFGAIADEGTNAEYVVPYGPAKPSGDGQRVKNRLLYRWYPTSGAKVSLVYKGFPYRDGTIPQDAGNVVHPGNGMGVSGFVPMETVPLNLHRLGGPVLKAADIDGVRAATDYNYLDFYDFSWKHPVTSAPYAAASLHAEASGATAITLPGHIMYAGSSAPEAHMGILGSPILSAGGTGEYTMALYATAGGIGSAQQAAWVADADMATYVPGYGSFTFSAAIQEVGYSSSAISSLAIYGSQELSIAGSDVYALWRQAGMDWNNVRFDAAPYAALNMHGTLGAASGTLPLLAAEAVTAYALHSVDTKLSVSGYDALSPGGMSAYGLRLPAGGDFFAAAAQSSNANWVISEQLVLPADMLSRRSSFYADEAVTLNAYTTMEAMDMAHADVSLVSVLTADLSSDVAANFMLATVWHSPVGIAALSIPTASSSTDVALSEQTVLTASFAISVPAAILAGDIGLAPASTMRMSISGDSALSIGGMSEYAMSLFGFSYDTPRAQMLDDVRTGAMSLSPAMSFGGAEQQVGWGSGLDALRILVSSEVCAGGSVPASLYYGISSKVVADMAGYTVESVPALFSLAVSSPLLRAETANEDEGITKAARERLVSQAVIELTDAQAASFSSSSAISFFGSLYSDYAAVTKYTGEALETTFGAHVALAEKAYLGFSPAISLDATLPEGYADIASSAVRIVISGDDVLYASGNYTIYATGSHYLASAGYAPMLVTAEHGYASMHDLSPAISFGAVETAVSVAGIDILNQCYAHIVGSPGMVIGGSATYGLYGGIVTISGENYSAVTVEASTGLLRMDAGSPYLSAAESVVTSTSAGGTTWMYPEAAHEVFLGIADFYADTAAVPFSAVEAPAIAMDEYASPAPGRKPAYFIFASGQYIYAEQSGAWLKTPYSVYKGNYSGKMHFSDGIAYECSQLAIVFTCAHQTGSAWAVSVAQDAYMGAVDHNRADAYVYWDIGNISSRDAHAVDSYPATSLSLEPQLVLPGTELSELPSITGQAIPHGRILGSDVLSIPGQGMYTITLTEDAVFGSLPPSITPSAVTIAQSVGGLDMWASYVTRNADMAGEVVYSNAAAFMQVAEYGHFVHADETLVVHNCSGRHYSDSPELKGTFWVGGASISTPSPAFEFTSFAVYDEHPAGCQIADSRVLMFAAVYEPGVSIGDALLPTHMDYATHRAEDVICVAACGANKPGSVLLYGAVSEPVYTYSALLGDVLTQVVHVVDTVVPFLACGAVGGPLLSASLGYSDGVSAYESCWREIPMPVNVVTEEGVLTGGCPPEFSYVAMPAFVMDTPSVHHAHGHRDSEVLMVHTVLELPVVSCRNADSVVARAGSVQEVVNVEYGILPPALCNNTAFEVTHTAVLTDLMTAQCFCRVHAYYPGYMLDVAPVAASADGIMPILHDSAVVIAGQLDPHFCTGRLFDDHPFGCHTTGDALGGLIASVPDTGASEYEKAAAFVVTQDVGTASCFGATQSFSGLEVTLGVTTSASILAAIKQETHAVDMGFSLCLSASNFWHCGMYAVALNAVIPTWIVPRLMFIPVIPDLEFWFDYEEDSPFKLSFVF